MDRFIPEHIDPYRYAEQRLGLDGIVNIADMQRLSSSLHTSHGKVTVHLQFGVDEQDIAFLKGHLNTTLTLQCQRCMEPFDYEIISDFTLGIVNTLDEVNTLPEYYEPALTKEKSLALRDLIEDELILNLPIIPRHELEECKVRLPISGIGSEEETKTESPFRVLESLKGKKK